MRFRYFDPAEQNTVDGDVHSAADVTELVAHVAGLGRGRTPAVELHGHDGSSLILGIAGPRAVLLFTDAEGRASHSVAASPAPAASAEVPADGGIVFDWFGSYTEFPAAYAVPVDVAIEAADGFRAGARPPRAAGLLLRADAVAV